MICCVQEPLKIGNLSTLAQTQLWKTHFGNGTWYHWISRESLLSSSDPNCILKNISHALFFFHLFRVKFQWALTWATLFFCLSFIHFFNFIICVSNISYFFFLHFWKSWAKFAPFFSWAPALQNVCGHALTLFYLCLFIPVKPLESWAVWFILWN